ncbi:M1 family metallopeptidase [Apibacter sp. B3706]|uniref:M1 family metallopeptidase n=1 Tax=Apibacter sp. B3706 TaxID=2656760 RepID=UPI00140E5AD3|nr:M1 family metallopeptidase [Apibacter sp. B3706]QII70386.1 M1 family metallopeptidase [Apibacter sp. B3706]
MKILRILSNIILVILPVLCFSQSDKILISATLDSLTKNISVKQKIVFYNNTGITLDKIYLHAAANSYSNTNTVLGKRKLEDRNKTLYFSKYMDRGRINDLTIFINKRQPVFLLRDFEFYEVNLFSPLLPNDSISLDLNYNIKIPSNKITGYGFSSKGTYVLKNFFIQPLDFINSKPKLEPFTDTEFNPYRKTNYTINFYHPMGLYMDGDLTKAGENQLQGTSGDAVTMILTKNKPISFIYTINGSQTEVVIGYSINEKFKEVYYKNIKRELLFLNEKLGKLPSKLLISSKIKKDRNFIGVDDIKLLGLKEWKLFPDDVKIDLKMFQQIAYSVINQVIQVDKNKYHWIPNGLLTYYQLNYLKKYYPDTKLLGNLPKELSIIKIKPLQYFFISKVPITDRYKLGYRYIATQNYDQPISEDFLELSNINQYIISGFKSGLSFNFLSAYLGADLFENSVKKLIEEGKDREITSSDFQRILEINSQKNLAWFFQNYIVTNDRINFKIKKFYEDKYEKDTIKVRITNKTALPIPILITGEKNKKIINQKWVFSTNKDSLYSFKNGEYDRLLINKNYLFPEINDNDNLLNTEGIYKNRKKLQMKFYADVDNPNYTQIFYEPNINWNNYDKFILGLRFYNSSPFSRPFEYSFSPTYSTGTKSLTGSGALNYNYDMEEGLFRRMSMGTGYTYYHYDKNLSYKKYSGNVNLIFKKRPRSDINRTIGISFNSVEREKDPFKILEKNDYSHYNLLDLSYSHSDKRIINEWYSKTNFQHSNIFNKISTEIYFRHEYAPNKKISLRYFGGYFINNHSNSTYFDFGVDHITDYSFNYMDYLGRSATGGLFYQQYIMAEGGFKSMLDKSANKWITSLNGEIHLWKPFDLYADMGLYSNKKKSTYFIYDSGVKLNIIPEFLELYLPIQSTLGFEPAKNNYLSHIRFTFNFNLSAVVTHFRRGWY